MSALNTDKNVYILGAGFSKELGLPLQDDFILIAREVYFRDPNRYKHFEKVFRYQDELSRMRKYLFPCKKLIPLIPRYNTLDSLLRYFQLNKETDFQDKF